MLQKILQFKEKFKSVFSSASHAIMLESEDYELSKNVALLFAQYLCCENEEKPCGKCVACKKIQDGNSLDTITFFDKVIMVEDVEKIVENLPMTPVENEYKVVIVDNFDETSQRVQNKLLKSLEEPPKFVKFVLLVKNAKAVLPTVVSRCEVFSLSKFNSQEMLQMIGNEFDGNLSIVAIENCCGNYGIAVKFLKNAQFLNIYNLCFEMLSKMLNSSNLLEYSSKIIKNKDNFNLFLMLLENIFEDMIFCKTGNENLIKNKFSEDKIKQISNGYSMQAMVKIVEKIETVKEKLKYNVNFNLIVDNLLLYILEVKFKCK